jgi:hypothetical protein
MFLSTPPLGPWFSAFGKPQDHLENLDPSLECLIFQALVGIGLENLHF